MLYLRIKQLFYPLYDLVNDEEISFELIGSVSSSGDLKGRYKSGDNLTLFDLFV